MGKIMQTNRIALWIILPLPIPLVCLSSWPCSPDFPFPCLEAPSVDYGLFQRMRSRYPERVECVLRDVLKDQEFDLDRDFDALLEKFKGQAMRPPRRPMIAALRHYGRFRGEFRGTGLGKKAAFR